LLQSPWLLWWTRYAHCWHLFCPLLIAYHILTNSQQAYLGRLGPDVLGGAGVAVSAQYAVSKLYNDPLLRTSISLVASQDGKNRGTERTQDQAKELSIAVSSALLLAFCVGFIQLIIYSLLGDSITRGMKSLWGSVNLSASCDCLNGLNFPPHSQ
jgi:hypothetical protein